MPGATSSSRCPWASSALLILLSVGALCAQQPNPALASIDDETGLPRVLLIGDSISIGYTLGVRELLGGVANVHRIPENAGPSSKGVEKLDDWLGDGRWDVIHINHGLHDLKFMDDGERQVSLRDYEANLRKIAARLKETGARVIWAHTTPVPDAKVSPHRMPADVERYNAVAHRVMTAHGFAENDLYWFALAQLEHIQRPANVHFTADGSRQMAYAVAAAIHNALR